MYLAFFVLITLSQRTLAVSRLAVCTDAFPSKVIKLPPAVMRIWYGSSFWGKKSTTGLAYVKIFPLQVHARYCPTALHTLRSCFFGLSYCHLVPFPKNLSQTLFAKPRLLPDHSLIFLTRNGHPGDGVDHGIGVVFNVHMDLACFVSFACMYITLN